jgi:hypothetical protein
MGHSILWQDAMPKTTVSVDSEFQRFVIEQALALAREVETTAGQAPDGQVLRRCEGLLVIRGRDFLTQVLQQMTQHTADEAVKKGGPHEPAPAAIAPATKGARPARW